MLNLIHGEQKSNGVIGPDSNIFAQDLQQFPLFKLRYNIWSKMQEYGRKKLFSQKSETFMNCFVCPLEIQK